VDLPAPDASDELIEYLDQTGQSAENWLGVSAALLKREQETGDIQAGWLMTAFDYRLARRVGEERTRSGAFGDASRLTAGAIQRPSPMCPRRS